MDPIIWKEIRRQKKLKYTLILKILVFLSIILLNKNTNIYNLCIQLNVSTVISN